MTNAEPAVAGRADHIQVPQTEERSQGLRFSSDALPAPARAADPESLPAVSSSSAQGRLVLGSGNQPPCVPVSDTLSNQFRVFFLKDTGPMTSLPPLAGRTRKVRRGSQVLGSSGSSHCPLLPRACVLACPPWCPSAGSPAAGVAR